MYSKLPPADAGCTIMTRRERSPRGCMETGETVDGVPSNFSSSKGITLISSHSPNAIMRGRNSAQDDDERIWRDKWGFMLGCLSVGHYTTMGMSQAAFGFGFESPVFEILKIEQKIAANGNGHPPEERCDDRSTGAFALGESRLNRSAGLSTIVACHFL